jgi:dihydrofolate reductase
VPGDIVSFGGAGIANSLIRLGLVDEYRLMVTPEIWSDGKRLFEAGLPRGAVRSMEAFTLDTEAVILHYAAA